MKNEKVITGVIRDVVEQRGGEAPEVLRDELLLVEELGIRSLDLAQVVAELEFRLGRDPFASGASITGIRTVGDLCRAYLREAAAGDESDQTAAREGTDRAAARLRARERRRIEPALDTRPD